MGNVLVNLCLVGGLLYVVYSMWFVGKIILVCR